MTGVNCRVPTNGPLNTDIRGTTDIDELLANKQAAHDNIDVG
jgi:hypothetical protein